MVYIMVVQFTSARFLLRNITQLSSAPLRTLAFLTKNAHTIGYQDNLQTLACVMRVLEEAEMAARTSLHNFRVVLTFGLLLVLFGSTLHLSSTGTQGKDAHLAKRSASLRGPAPDMNSTLPPLSLHQRVSAYSTTPKAPEDQLAVAFWNGDWYMRMMMGNEDDAENVIQHQLHLGSDPLGQHWQRDHVKRGDAENWWTLGFLGTDQWRPPGRDAVFHGSSKCALTSIERALEDMSDRSDGGKFSYSKVKQAQGPTLCMKAKLLGGITTWVR